MQQAKDHLRILHFEEEAVIEHFIAVATEHLEWYTGRTVYQTEREVAIDNFSCRVIIQLPRALPFISITSIKYTDSEGVETELSPSLYAVDTYRGRVMPAYGESWPSFTPYPVNAVRIRYKAGHPTDLSPQTYVSAAIRQCILEMVGGLYENRESVVATDRSTVAAFAENPFTKRLLTQLKLEYAF